jgi:hypothetical protein
MLQKPITNGGDADGQPQLHLQFKQGDIRLFFHGRHQRLGFFGGDFRRASAAPRVGREMPLGFLARVPIVNRAQADAEFVGNFFFGLGLERAYDALPQVDGIGERSGVRALIVDSGPDSR